MKNSEKQCSVKPSVGICEYSVTVGTAFRVPVLYYEYV